MVSIIFPLKPVTILIIKKYHKRPGYYIFWNKQGSAKAIYKSKTLIISSILKIYSFVIKPSKTKNVLPE